MVSAPPTSHVVLLHGQPGAGSDWDEVVRLLPADMTTLAIDRPGYRSSPHAPASLVRNAELLLEQLDERGVAQTVLVGHSYGGGVAVAVAATAPERVRGIVLVSSIGPGCLDGWDRLLAAPVTGPVCAVSAWWLTPWFARARLATLRRMRGRALDDDENLYWEIWGNARHEHGAMWRTFLVEQRELVRNLHELDAMLDRVTAPALVIADPADKMIPVATAQALHARLRGSRLKLVEHGGHHIPRRTPEVVAASIVEFIDSLG